MSTPRLSNQFAVTTPGTEVQGPTTPIGNVFAVKAHPSNTGAIWIGNLNSAVSSVSGFPLEAGEGIVLHTRSLDKYYFDVDVAGENICWILLEE